MKLYERLLKSFKGRKEEEQEEEEIDVAEIKKTLASIVYEEEIVEEFLPTFTKLYAQEGFNRVIELLEAKEQQIQSISGGEWFKHTSGKGDEEEDIGEDGSEETFNLSEEVEALISKEYEEN